MTPLLKTLRDFIKAPPPLPEIRLPVHNSLLVRGVVSLDMYLRREIARWLRESGVKEWKVKSNRSFGTLETHDVVFREMSAAVIFKLRYGEEIAKEVRRRSIFSRTQI